MNWWGWLKPRVRVPKIAVCPYCEQPTTLYYGLGAEVDICPTHGYVEPVWVPERRGVIDDKLGVQVESVGVGKTPTG